MEDMRNAYSIFVGKLEGKRPLGKPKRRWESNIRMDIRRKAWNSVDWIHLAQVGCHWLVVVKTVMKLWVP
jgi:hypothetical protein